MTDLELIVAARTDVRAADRCVRRFEGVVRVQAARFHPWPGATYDDVLQEGRVGVVKAIRAFRPGLSAGGVQGFVSMCVRRQLISCLIASARQRQTLLNQASTWTVDVDGEPVPVLELQEDPRGRDMAELLDGRERLRRILGAPLSAVERAAVDGALVGLTYDDVGPRKRVDNALQRARTKLAA